MSDIPEGWSAEVLGTVAVGREYERWIAAPEGQREEPARYFGRYRVEAFGTDLRCGTEVVVARRLDGCCAGRLVVCGLRAFVVGFRPVPEAEAPSPDSPPPEKVAGVIPEVGGW